MIRLESRIKLENRVKLHSDLRQLHRLIQIRRPERMDHLVRFVVESGCLSDYRFHFVIVRHQQIVKGVRIVVTLRCNRQMSLPARHAYYLVTLGMQKYIDGGWEIQDFN